MGAADLLKALHAAGVAVRVDGDDLRLVGQATAIERFRPLVAERKGEIVAALKVGAGETASRWWLLHFADREPVEVACCPEATHAEILERHPGAVAAEPFEPAIRQPSAPLTADEEA
ncbi:MAG: hypothetical protein N3C63_01765 [Rhodocyclaceae bacterium]|nr:hypothetical protein [Rhodocyclaceae bacterium]